MRLFIILEGMEWEKEKLFNDGNEFYDHDCVREELDDPPPPEGYLTRNGESNIAGPLVANTVWRYHVGDSLGA